MSKKKKKKKVVISEVEGMGSIYYDIKKDIEKYPDAWAYVIYGGRKRGKTYSTMKTVKTEGIDFIFMKRTIKDANTLCAGAKLKDIEINLSPFKALNRDMGWNVKPRKIDDGIGGFWDVNEEGEMSGEPIGWIFALNGVTQYKGFELASSGKDQYIVFDEFVPNIYDRQNREEGKQMLDFYMTVSRDRIQRGLNEIKLICLTNATNVVSPLMDEMGLVDEIAEMEILEQGTKYIADKKILLRKLPPREDDDEKETGIYRTMRNTDWGDMTWGNEFAYNDFSNVEHLALKKYAPVCTFIYKRDTWYLYKKGNQYYMSTSKHNSNKVYNLNRENEQKKAWNDIIYKLRCKTIEEKVRYEKYTMYDLVINYKKIFKL